MDGVFAHCYGEGYKDDESFTSLETASSTVTHIELRQCQPDPCELEHMICACKNLKTLIYEKGEGHISYEAFKTEEIQKAMQPAKATLENLWLDYASLQPSEETY